MLKNRWNLFESLSNDELIFVYEIGKLFFKNLKNDKMKLLKVPAKTSSGLPEIYLPFTPRFFHVHGLNLQDHYTIEYITNTELNNRKRNTLYAATNSEIFRDFCTIYDLKIGDQDRLIEQTRNTFFSVSSTIYNYRNDTWKVERNYDDVKSVRFILLILRCDTFF